MYDLEKIKLKIAQDFKKQFGKDIEKSLCEKFANQHIQRLEKGDGITEQVNLIAQNRQRRNREKGLKEHTLKWTIESMKTIKDISRFYTQEKFNPPKIDWNHELSFKKPADSLRVIIAYLYVKLFYYG